MVCFFASVLGGWTPFLQLHWTKLAIFVGFFSLEISIKNLLYTANIFLLVSVTLDKILCGTAAWAGQTVERSGDPSWRESGPPGFWLWYSWVTLLVLARGYCTCGPSSSPLSVKNLPASQLFRSTRQCLLTWSPFCVQTLSPYQPPFLYLGAWIQSQTFK